MTDKVWLLLLQGIARRSPVLSALPLWLWPLVLVTQTRGFSEIRNGFFTYFWARLAASTWWRSVATVILSPINRVLLAGAMWTSCLESTYFTQPTRRCSSCGDGENQTRYSTLGCKRRPKWVPGAWGYGWATLPRGFYWWGWESCCPSCQVSWRVWMTAYRIPAVSQSPSVFDSPYHRCRRDLLHGGPDWHFAYMFNISRPIQRKFGTRLSKKRTGVIRISCQSARWKPYLCLGTTICVRISHCHCGVWVKVCGRDLHSVCACSESGHREGRALLAGASQMRFACTAKPYDVLK